MYLLVGRYEERVASMLLPNVSSCGCLASAPLSRQTGCSRVAPSSLYTGWTPDERKSPPGVLTLARYFDHNCESSATIVRSFFHPVLRTEIPSLLFLVLAPFHLSIQPTNTTSSRPPRPYTIALPSPSSYFSFPSFPSSCAMDRLPLLGNRQQDEEGQAARSDHVRRRPLDALPRPFVC